MPERFAVILDMKGLETENAEYCGKVAVVIVTFASERVLGLCVAALLAQTRQPDLIVIVDNNSPDPHYLDELPHTDRIRVIRNSRNEGFCVANNIGFNAVRSHQFVVFLNPDAFARNDMMRGAMLWMDAAEHAKVAAITGVLLKFDLELGRPTGGIDSTGIFQTWYGKWFDRDQGREWRVAEDAAANAEQVPALCGAFMFCRSRALEQCVLRGREVFDEKFFMYKEDIELSLRLRRFHWTLVYVPQLACFHCRGWTRRDQMPKWARYLSARNELRVCLRNHGKGIMYSLSKWLIVRVENAVLVSKKTKNRGI